MKLILATHNEGKTVEMQHALSHLPLEVITLNDYPHIGDIPETGNTLVENAFIKAETVFKETGIPALADDTGLEIDVLNGAPGVYSARYAGESATFEENCSKVIDELSKVAPEKRTARFRTVIAYVNKYENFAKGILNLQECNEFKTLQEKLFKSIWYVEVDENLIVLHNREPLHNFYYR